MINIDFTDTRCVLCQRNQQVEHNIFCQDCLDLKGAPLHLLREGEEAALREMMRERGEETKRRVQNARSSKSDKSSSV